MKRSLCCPFALPLAMGAICLVACGLGVLVFAEELHHYLEFPPTQIYIRHAGFSALFFIAYAALFAAAALFFAYLNYWHRPSVAQRVMGKFPGWGYAALVVLFFGWAVAWTRLEIFYPIQHHTYIIIWYSMIILLNAVLYLLTGSSPLYSKARYYMMLFPASAVFWWFFELLNRAVQNWFYEGVEHFSASEYALLATLSFTTVLPAVEIIFLILHRSLPAEVFGRCVKFKLLDNRHAPLLLLVTGFSGLFFLGREPDILFPMLWLSPLMVLWGLQRLKKTPSLLDQLIAGRWRESCLWALSAIICGFLWEMWNLYSLAKWVYLIPYVQCCYLFEMPLVGYAGYLPFGLLCGEIIRYFRLSHNCEQCYA